MLAKPPQKPNTRDKPSICLQRLRNMGRLPMVPSHHSRQCYEFRAKIHTPYAIRYRDQHRANDNDTRVQVNKKGWLNYTLSFFLDFTASSHSRGSFTRSKSSIIVFLHTSQCSKKAFSGMGPSTSQLIRFCLWKVKQQGGYSWLFWSLSRIAANFMKAISTCLLKLVIV